MVADHGAMAANAVPGGQPVDSGPSWAAWRGVATQDVARLPSLQTNIVPVPCAAFSISECFKKLSSRGGGAGPGVSSASLVELCTQCVVRIPQEHAEACEPAVKLLSSHLRFAYAITCNKWTYETPQGAEAAAASLVLSLVSLFSAAQDPALGSAASAGEAGIMYFNYILCPIPVFITCTHGFKMSCSHALGCTCKAQSPVLSAPVVLQGLAHVSPALASQNAASTATASKTQALTQTAHLLQVGQRS